MRKLRKSAVSELAGSSTFSDKVQRPHLPEVMALLKNKRFLYDREPDTLKAALEGHLRNPCILKVIITFTSLYYLLISQCAVDSKVCPTWTSCGDEW